MATDIDTRRWAQFCELAKKEGKSAIEKLRELIDKEIRDNRK